MLSQENFLARKPVRISLSINSNQCRPRMCDHCTQNLLILRSLQLLFMFRLTFVQTWICTDNTRDSCQQAKGQWCYLSQNIGPAVASWVYWTCSALFSEVPTYSYMLAALQHIPCAHSTFDGDGAFLQHWSMPLKRLCVVFLIFIVWKSQIMNWYAKVMLPINLSSCIPHNTNT